MDLPRQIFYLYSCVDFVEFRKNAVSIIAKRIFVTARIDLKFFAKVSRYSILPKTSWRSVFGTVYDLQNRKINLSRLFTLTGMFGEPNADHILIADKILNPSRGFVIAKLFRRRCAKAFCCEIKPPSAKNPGFKKVVKISHK